jgi:chemotaxis protein CheC
MDDFGILSKEQLDALKEVGTIGAGHAANALSQLAGRKIMISVPEVKAVPLKEVVELVGPPESIVAVVYMNLMGDARGKTLLIFPRQSAFNLVDILMKRPPGQTKFLKEMDSSAIKEVGNILTGAFLTTLADFLNIALIPSVPLLAYDMVGAILEALAIEFGEEADYIFCIQTEFTDPTLDIGGNFILVFDRKSLDTIIEKIDMKIKEMTANKNKT